MPRRDACFPARFCFREGEDGRTIFLLFFTHLNAILSLRKDPHFCFDQTFFVFNTTMGTRVYVGHIPYEARERDVEHFFDGYGKVRDILMKRGYCFVELSDPRDADDAVYDLNGKSMLGMNFPDLWYLFSESLSRLPRESQEEDMEVALADAEGALDPALPVVLMDAVDVVLAPDLLVVHLAVPCPDLPVVTPDPPTERTLALPARTPDHQREIRDPPHR
uniref:RRM domain-containing protein n=1 Tax=Bursaphelenchus xylophilus TaxID=6326 RepID=A0A1I7SD50_BURXY